MMGNEGAVLVLLQLAIAAVVLAIVAGWRRHQRRSSFDSTIARVHPELARGLPVHVGELGPVAARAIDLDTPGAPRQLGDQVLR